MEQRLDHHGFCELEFVVCFIGFKTILEQFKEAISKLRQYREALATGPGEGSLPLGLLGLWVMARFAI